MLTPTPRFLKALPTFTLLILLVFSLSSCKDKTPKPSSEVTNVSYVCPMDCPDSKSDKSGLCPVCNMHLVKEIEVDKMNQTEANADTSVFKLDAVWTDQKGESRQLADYKGKLHITTMIFTRCDYACPNIIGDIQNIEDELTPAAKANVDYILVTIDPENDTYERLNSYADKFDLDHSQWHFLTGNKDDIYSYSKLLGIGYKKFENGYYGHSNIITLLNESGEIIHQIEGIHANATEIVKLLNMLSE